MGIRDIYVNRWRKLGLVVAVAVAGALLVDLALEPLWSGLGLWAGLRQAADRSGSSSLVMLLSLACENLPLLSVGVGCGILAGYLFGRRAWVTPTLLVTALLAVVPRVVVVAQGTRGPWRLSELIGMELALAMTQFSLIVGPVLLAARLATRLHVERRRSAFPVLPPRPAQDPPPPKTPGKPGAI